MAEKKEIIVSTRVSFRTFQYLKKYCQNYDLSNSKLVRKAIRYYLKFAHRDDKNISYVLPKIIINKEDFKFMINCLDEIEIKEFAKKSYENTLQGIQGYFLTIYGEKVNPLEIKPRALLNILKNNIFQYDGQNWFNSVKYLFNKDLLIFGGNHGFNEKFSLYVKYYLLNFLKSHSYHLIHENLGENKILLTFKLKKNETA
ncbi:MAG: hypothetical protein ACTSU4_11030 [Promethearchaeota archaeon]